jgi:hypothetical protein
MAVQCADHRGEADHSLRRDRLDGWRGPSKPSFTATPRSPQTIGCWRAALLPVKDSVRLVIHR